MTNAEILARGYWAKHVEQVNQFFEDGLLDFDSLPERERNDIISRCEAGLKDLTAAGLCIMPVEAGACLVMIEERGDGGVRVSSPTHPGLILSGSDGAMVSGDIVPAWRALEDHARPMTGILPTMTPEQQSKAIAGTDVREVLGETEVGK